MTVSIEKTNDGTFIAYNKDSERFSLIGTGESVKEAKADFLNSIMEMTECFIERGETVPEELTLAPVFEFDLSSLLEYYSMLNVSALGRYIGINPSLMRQYKKGDTPISSAQLKKIEIGLRQLGNELSSLRFV